MKVVFRALLTLALGVSTVAACAVDNPSNMFQNTKREVRLERKKVKAQLIAKMVDSVVMERDFVFVAQRALTALPSRPYISLAPGYDLVVSKDTLVSNLPFYGRMYSGAMDAAKNPLNFSCSNLVYKQQGLPKGKEKALVNIIATAHGIQFKISIEVFDTATAIMTVEMQNGSSSTFYGHIEPLKNNKN